MVSSSDARYEFVVPPGWTRLDLRRALAPQVDELMGSMLEDAPADRRAAAEPALKSRLLSMLTDLAGGGVLDLVIPMVAYEGVTFPASFAFTRFAIPPGTDPIDVLTALAMTDSTADLREISDLVALRTSSTEFVNADAVAAQLTLAAVEAGLVVERGHDPGGAAGAILSRRVRYVVGVPEDRERWIMVLFSALETEDTDSIELVAGLEALFDTVMSSMRFR